MRTFNCPSRAVNHMADVVDPSTRSRMMSSIRGTNTQPELLVRRYLQRTGLRFRVHDKELPGRPDIILPQYRAAVFVHGCFWHRHHGCRFATMPSTRVDFWARKFEATMVRDVRTEAAVRQAGWRPLTIWECEVQDVEALEKLFWAIVSGVD